MDLETENKIAAILLKEAAELRRQAEKEGVQVYLQQPKSRGRPNSQFLTATVRGVQQANRAVEENEMWRARQKELELDNQLRRTRYQDTSPNRYMNSKESGRSSKSQHDVEVDMLPSCSSRKRVYEDCDIRKDVGLRDEEVDEFLHSRIKRGRGSVGSRMDETGPYLPSSSDTQEKQSVTPLVGQREWQEKRAILGPEKPSSLESSEYSEHESSQEKQKAKRRVSSRKERSRKHKSKEKSKDRDKKKKKRMREEKRSKHQK